MLQSQGRPIRPGDVIILVPRRGVFTGAMIRELKARNIPVAGTDRMVLAEQLAVMDLIALGDFLLMQEDDLALATVLKSPLFGFDDDDLFALAWDRKGSLWRSMREWADLEPDYGRAVERLEAWLDRADFAPPYEFFAGLLEENGMEMRKRLIARLGADAGDALDEFLNVALAYERDHPPSLQGFLDAVRTAEMQVKRDMEQGRDEVRVMTVFGAKGLEAEIVFLPDTCAIPRGSGGPTVLNALRNFASPGTPDHIVWVPSGTPGLPELEEAKERRKEAERQEYHRLLYVAMTRARDRLYVCGWEHSRGRETGCWYQLVSEGLKGLSEETKDAEGRTVWRFRKGDAVRRKKAPEVARAEVEELPEWALRDAPSEPARALPVAASAIGVAAEAPMAEQEVLSPERLADQSRFLRGLLVHALLQHLPALEPEQREKTARTYVDARGAELDKQTRDEIVAETLAVLNDPEFAPLFGPDSLAEVPLAARIARKGDAPPYDITGQIDRLVALDDAILIVDYKTNRPPPKREEDVAPGYIAQLTAYRAGIGALFPDKTVRAALLWTDGPDLMEISHAAMDSALVDIGVPPARP